MNWDEGGQPDHLTFAGLRGGGGKGGSTNTTTNTSGTSQVAIPDWLDQASQAAVAQGFNLSQQPYTPYTGQIVAGTPQATQQAYQQVRAMQGAADPTYQASQNVYGGLLGQATPQTADQINALSSQLYGNYNQNVMAPTQGLLGGYLQNASPATAAQVGANAMQLMSPYESAVINPALAAGQQQLALANQKIAGQAANVGAFGGSRQGVAEGVAESQAALGTGQAIGNLLQQGWQANLNPAYNLASQAAQQGYGAAGLLAQLGQQGYNQAATQAGGIANTNLGLGMTAVQQAPALATAQQAEAQKEAGLMQAIGGSQQQQQQAQLAAQMGQFYEQQQYPYQSLDALLSTLGAVPYGTSTTTTGTGQSTATKTPGLLDYISAASGAAAKGISLL
jgi:hypothetical protein